MPDWFKVLVDPMMFAINKPWIIVLAVICFACFVGVGIFTGTELKKGKGAEEKDEIINEEND